MQVELNKEDIIYLLKGIGPRTYDAMDLITNMGLGDYTGGFANKFYWNSATNDCWKKYSENELFKLYLKIKQQ